MLIIIPVQISKKNISKLFSRSATRKRGTKVNVLYLLAKKVSK